MAIAWPWYPPPKIEVIQQVIELVDDRAIAPAGLERERLVIGREHIWRKKPPKRRHQAQLRLAVREVRGRIDQRRVSRSESRCRLPLQRLPWMRDGPCAGSSIKPGSRPYEALDRAAVAPRQPSVI